MTQRAAPELAYVLHHHDWSETSLIVELFTLRLGRLVVVAKGVKRPTSQLRAVLLPFQPVQALLGRSPGETEAELRTLRGAEWVGGVALLPAAAMFSGFYLNELLLRLLARQDPHPALFEIYSDTLQALALGLDEACCLRSFELGLLHETGVLPELDVATLTTQALQPHVPYALHAEAGVLQREGGLPGSHWLALAAAMGLSGPAERIQALRRVCAALASAHRAALREQLRDVLDYHLGQQGLRTRQVMRGVQRLNEGAMS